MINTKSSMQILTNVHGFVKENITESNFIIDSMDKYSELYEQSNGSISSFEDGWCAFYQKPKKGLLDIDKKNTVKLTLHKVAKGVAWTLGQNI